MQCNKNNNHWEDVDMDWEWPLLSVDDVSMSDSKADTSRNWETPGSIELDFFRWVKFLWDANVEAKAST